MRSKRSSRRLEAGWHCWPPPARSPASFRALGEATDTLAALDASLRGVPGLAGLVGGPGAIRALEEGAGDVDALVSAFEAVLDAGDLALSTEDVEEVNAALVRLRDVTWALGRDRLNAARSVRGLVESLGLGPPAGPFRGGRRSGCCGRYTWLSSPSTASRSGAGTRPAYT